MQIQITGVANLKQAQAQFAALTAQVESLNMAMAQAAMMPMGGDPKGFKRISAAANATTAAYGQALASTGAFRVEQVKINDEIARQTDLLQRSKLGFSQVFGKKSRNMMRAIYREQLALNQATARMHTGLVGDGKTRMTMGIPTQVHKSWDDLNARVGMFRTQLHSASSELVNWGKNTQWAGRQLMVGFTMPVLAFGAAAGVMAYQVDKQFTRIAKVYDTTADANSRSLREQMKVEAELNKLREDGMRTARESAYAYGASVTDTLEVQAELAAVGQTGQRLQEGTNQVMRIATLGEIEHGVATKALIALQATLGATVKESGDAFNYMNAIENATSLTTDDFANAIPRALGPMREMSAEGASASEVLQNMSILMVAMKERGIEAGEGANAIKAMMQRLYRPSKQVREEWQQIANVDPLKFVQETGGNIMEMLPRIAAATQELDKASRIKLLAGLFGTYQVTRMSAMLKGISDMEKGIGQVSRVVEVNQQTIEDWGDTAERELAKQAESASGRFKRAFEGLKAELASIGDPFLEAASWVVKFASATLKLINSMPSWAKKGLIFSAMLAAIVGPVVMLIGLFANFAGNIGKFVAWSLKAVSSFQVMSKAQWAAKVSAELAESAFMKEASAGEILERQMKALTFAAHEQSVAMARLAKIPVRNVPVNTAALPVAANPFVSSFGARYGGAMAGPMTNLANPATASNVLKENLGESKKHMQAIGASAGVAAGAMAVMMMTSNETANNIAHWALISTMVVPAAATLVPLIGRAGSKAMSLSRNVGSAGNMTKSLASNAKSAAIGFARLLGPIGWITLGLTAVGTALYKLHKRAQEETKKQIEYQKALHNSASDWADVIGVAVKRTKTLNSISSFGYQRGDKSPAEMAEELANTDSGKKIIDMYEEAETAAERNTIAFSQWIEVLQATDGDVESARRALEALFIAAGQGALEAETNALEFVNAYGRLDLTDVGKLWKQQMESALELDSEVAATKGTEMGRDLADAIANAASGHEVQGIMAQFSGVIGDIWSEEVDKAGMMMSSATKDALAGIGVEEADMTQFFKDFQSSVAGDITQQDFEVKWGLDVLSTENLDEYYMVMNELRGLGQQINVDGERAKLIEEQVVKELMRQRGIKKDISTFAELANTWEWQILGATQQNSKALFKQRIHEMERLRTVNGLLDIHGAVSEEEKLHILNQIRLARGMKPATDLAQGFRRQVSVAADEAGRLKNNLSGLDIEIKSDQLKDLLKSGMSGVQEDISDMLSDNFETGMEAAIDQNESYWDGRLTNLERMQEAAQKRMENNHENIMDRFEQRWERRRDSVEKAYDKRIDKVNEAVEAEQRAEEIRQRIFEAEQTRLDRLTETANRSIDFNMAIQTGDLDEAAKIRNDMDAAAQEWALSDAAAAGGRRSDRRRERLEDRADRLSERKDRVLDQLQKREDAERKSLERRLERERDHLDKVQEMNRNALEANADAAKDAFRDEWEARRDSLNDQLETFKAFVPKNQKQLEAWMDQVGITYKNFGIQKLNPRAEQWGRWFKESLKDNIQLAGRQIGSDNMWEAMGAKTAKKTLRGMGFGSLRAFERFIMTGNLPKNFGKVRRRAREESRGGRDQRYPHEPTSPGIFRHTGGTIDGGAGSRKGVARNVKGLHPSERLVTARVGETMVNEDATKKYGSILSAMNKGIFDPNVMGGAGVGGFTSLIAAAVGRGMAAGVSASFIKAYTKSSSAGVGRFGDISAGAYGDLSFDAEQLRNAGIIASVGKDMGMSARDIAIGIMTAITESMLRNVRYGDRDSQGLFQQRPSQGWGTVEQVTNPEYAARKFFSALKGVTNRNAMSPWMAAQTVQRSAFSDGSNYQIYWDEGQAIFDALRGAGANLMGYVPGKGGRHRPIKNYGYGGIHGTDTGYPAVDFAAPTGTPVYAVADGKVTRSYDISGPLASDTYKGTGPYGSYGRVIYLKTDAGPEVLYAHLSQRSVRAGQNVKGGSILGRSGNTGNSSGPHLHFGATNGPLAWLKNGGMTLNDGIAMLHRGETVLTKDLSSDLKDTVSAFGAAARGVMGGRGRIDRSEANMWGPETTRVDRSRRSGGWTWISGMIQAVTEAARLKKSKLSNLPTVQNTGKGQVVRNGTYNVHSATTDKAAKSSVARLMPHADVLSLTEMKGKINSFSRWFRERGWGLFAGGGSGKYATDAAIAWNNKKYQFKRGGTRKLGDLTGDFEGGRAKRFAKYALLQNRRTRDAFWQISAHTVPTPVLGRTRLKMFNEQYGNLDRLVNELRGTGAPVFAGGDFNQHKGRSWWRNLQGMRSGRKYGIDHVFHDPRMAKFIGGRKVSGLSSNHDAWLAQFNIPSRKDGAENIRWDNTLVNMHKKESLLTDDQSDKFRWLADNIDKVAMGGGNQYNIDVKVMEPGASAEQIAREVKRVFDREESRKPVRRRR